MTVRTWCQASWLRAILRASGLLLVTAMVLGAASALAGTFTLTLQPNTIPSATENSPFNQLITAVGGNAPYTFQVTSGSLPVGIVLDSDGTLHGTPTTANSYTFTITATDNDGNTGFRPYTFSVGQAGGLSVNISPGSLPNGQVGNPYSQTISTSGGSGGYVYSISSGSLPPGLSINSGGVISGNPNTAGYFGFTVFVRDSDGNTGTKNYNVTINAQLTVNPATLPNGSLGTPYNRTITATGGTAPYTYAITGGAIPGGLSFDTNTGILSGTPNAGGSFNFTITATDSIGSTGSRAYTVNIGTNTLVVNPATLPVGTQGLPYSRTVVATNGNGNYTYSISSGALPPGLTLNGSSGVISGTPTASGSYPFTVRADDTAGAFGTRAYTLNIGGNILIVNPATLAPPIKGKSYSLTVIAGGGTAPYTYSVSGGALPPGLTLNTATGAITGTPTSTGTFAFTIQALDVNGNIGSRAYSLTSRPDPALDPEVTGLVNAQVEVARRFAEAQVDNVSRHLESLHDHFDPCSFDFGVALPQSNDGNALYGASPGNASRTYDPLRPSVYGQQPRRTPGSPGCGDASNFAFWISGAVQFGSDAAIGPATANNKFTSSGMTAGIDWRRMENLILGVAVGFGADRTDVGANGTRNDATSYSAMVYGSYKPFGEWFIDGLAGYGTLDNSSRRWVSDDSVTVGGNRKGGYWFGAISTGYDIKYGALRLSPYVRADFMSATLDAYAEQGSSAELLSYNATNFSTVAGAVGLRGSYDIPVSWGILTPTARAEYRQAFDGSFQQSMYYSDIGPSMTSIMTQDSATRSMVNASLGIRARGLGGMNAELDYGISSSGGSLQSQTVRGALKLPF